jgi:hypothetical protein
VYCGPEKHAALPTSGSYATLMMDFPLASTTGTTFGAINLVGLLLYTDFFTLIGKNAPKETPTKNLLKFDDFKV